MKIMEKNVAIKEKKEKKQSFQTGKSALPG